MPIKFTCRQCDKKLRASSRHVGRTLECPHCGKMIRVPSPTPPGTAPSSADLAGAPVSRSKDLLEGDRKQATRPSLTKPQAAPQRRPAKAAAPAPAASPGGLPFDDDEWDAALNPYEAPKEDDKKLPSYAEQGPGVKPGSMRWTKRGLLLVWLSIWGGLISSTLARVAEFAADPETSEAGMLAVVSGLGLMGTGALSLIGQILCITVPAKTGARGQAIASGASLVICVLSGGAIFATAESNPSDIIPLAMLMLIGAAATYICFLLFLKKLGGFYNYRDVTEGVDKLFVYGVSIIVGVLLIPACLAAAVAFDGFGWLIFVAGFIGFGIWIGSWAVFFVYASTVRKLIDAIRD